MIEWIVEFSTDTMMFNSIFGILLYWLPLVVCSFGYTTRTFKNIHKDKLKRSEEEKKEKGYYAPTDTIGDLIGRAIVSIIPLANLWACAFDVSPEVFRKAIMWLSRTFDQPLVPVRKEQNDARWRR